MDPPEAIAAAPQPPQHQQTRRRKGARFARRSLLFAISFAILLLLTLHPLVDNNLVQRTRISKIDLPQQLQSALNLKEQSKESAVPEISPLDHFVPLPLPAEVPDYIPPDFHKWNCTNSTPPSVWFDALDTYGNRGHVADPTLLRKSVLQWHKEHPNATYWDRLQKYQSHLLKKKDEGYMYMEETCKLIPGISVFGQGGITMLMERIKVDKVPTLRMGGKDCLEQEETYGDGNNNTTKKKKLKLFCGVYSHDDHRDELRLAALSYGIKCDGFLAFSTATIPSLGMVALLHRGKEMYDNMFQKTRSILSYVAMHYLDDYDYFHLGGDDMHIIGELCIAC